MINFSESAPSSVSIIPPLLKLYPIIPMKIATPIEMTTQIDAILRDNVISLSSLIAINRRRICGIPKYPSPHAKVEAIFTAPYSTAAPSL